MYVFLLVICILIRLVFSCSRLAPEPKLLPQEEVTYAEPVLVPAPGPNKLNSPKSTLRKAHNANHAAETLFQFSDNYTPPPRDPYAHQRGRDNFGTLRSHQGDGYRSGRAPPGSGIVSDGFGTARSAKKVYL